MLKIFLLIIIIILQSCSPCIVDIYYAASLNEKSKTTARESLRDKQCYYTTTECKTDCTLEYINRKHYNDWANKYTDLGLEPPHPKREGKSDLFVSFY